jgi:hypothetical protein
MKIAHNTPEQLELKSVPGILVITLSILLLVAVAFGMNA